MSNEPHLCVWVSLKQQMLPYQSSAEGNFGLQVLNISKRLISYTFLAAHRLKMDHDGVGNFLYTQYKVSH